MLASGWLLTLAGTVIALHTELPPLLRAALVAAWLVHAGASLLRQAAGCNRVRRIVISNGGSVHCRGRDGPFPARLLAGSVVLARFAWLRLELPGGDVYGEWLSETCCGEHAWRRLRVLSEFGGLCHHD